MMNLKDTYTATCHYIMIDLICFCLFFSFVRLFVSVASYLVLYCLLYM